MVATRVEIKRFAPFFVACLACHVFSYVQAQEQPDDYLACSRTDHTLALEDVDSLNAGFGGAEAHYVLAEQSRLAGDQERAEREFKAAVAQMPRGDKYVRALALFEVDTARYEEAIAIIKDYVKVCGETALGWELESGTAVQTETIRRRLRGGPTLPRLIQGQCPDARSAGIDLDH